jgi:predicted phosphodiesterase
MSWLTKLVSPNRVRTMVQAQDRIWERTGLGASDALKGKRKLPHGAPRPDLLVMGHTHVPDWAPLDDGRLYVNLGTWTDRAFDAHSPKDMSLPYLLISEREAVLRDADGEIELQRWSR